MVQLNLMVLALGFYTRLPVPNNQDYSQLPKASLLLPFVGWVVGVLVGLSYYLSSLFWSQTVAIVLALISGILLTGAFHEDGFADVCDGFGGGYDKQRILEIMKDSRIGAYGALGLVMLISLKISVLLALPSGHLPFVLLAGHSLSRLPPLLTMRSYDYVRLNDSKGSIAAIKPKMSEIMPATVAAFLPLVFLPVVCSVSIVFLLLVNWRLGHFFYKHIGGYTGDCLGASQQIAEVVFYLSVSAFWKFT